jgi:SAM-dependent methyltransferase
LDDAAEIMLAAVLARTKLRAEAAYVAVCQGLDRLILERRYGFPPEASHKIALSEFGLDADHRVGYQPSPRAFLRQLLRNIEIGENDVFLDLGSGMGHVVLEAARRPLRRVIGVELVPEFTSIARQTIERNRRRLRCREVDLVTADAVDYPIPDDVTVVYLFNPFRGPVFDAAIRNLLASIDRNPRSISILYSGPFDEDRLMATGRARFVGRGRRRIRRWAPADYLAVYELLPGPTAE